MVFIFGAPLLVALIIGAPNAGATSDQARLGSVEKDSLYGHSDPAALKKLQAACPDYKQYSTVPHLPLSEGPLALPYQRPAPPCRKFVSEAVEEVISNFTKSMVDKDLEMLFRNSFPNVLDTTIRWHVDGTQKKAHHARPSWGVWNGPHTFVVTGDINAMWLRDSQGQLRQYQFLAKKDERLANLILGAIATQAEYVIQAPYCNAFQPPPPSGLAPSANGQQDVVNPVFDPDQVFECKWELDSLANFLSLGTQFFNNTQSTKFLTPRWYTALDTVLKVLTEQSQPTFDPKSGRFEQNEYTFQRQTDAGTETLNLKGVGNPLSAGTGLIRSAFRPSDDSTILQYLIPSNALMAVELKRTAEMLNTVGKTSLAKTLRKRGEALEKAVWEHGVFKHKKWGDVFAYEVDGYGSAIFLDDANLPSLLSLPWIGFLDSSDQVYQNTRKMVLSKEGNPYFLQGRKFKGIGGPHVGLESPWPMSLLIQAATSDSDEEIMEALHLVRNASQLGLIHESVHVDRLSEYTRSWFAWACSLFAETILDLANRKPHLLFGTEA
ncbi:MAG: E3 ubiquitin-protein ligase rad18 [Watsoniomyces obsoletus]|nr:MAG: E3 ubiquitin-protein ligase rad18 [Watsoniomyces obsoletus]